MKLYIEDIKNSTKRLIEVINKFNHIAGYKAFTQKPIAFMFFNNGPIMKDIRKTILFTTASRKIKHLENDQVKKVNCLCDNSYRTC